jgi:hypothetical protein
MINNLPLYISIVFILTTLLTVYLFYKATRQSKTSMVVIALWLMIQAVLAFTGFYTVTDGFPPRLILIALPAILFIVILFLNKKGKVFLDSLDTATLTILHIVRIPVEICLYWLFLHKSIPHLMTFEGRNFDILSGITAPVIFYFGYIKKGMNKGVLLLWNFICLGLLFNIVINAILSVTTPFQQFAFNQPNTAILYFPFVWLPCCVVPLVLLAHLASIRKLLLKK